MSRTRAELRTEQRQARTDRVLLALAAALPELDSATAAAVLEEADAVRGKALRELDEHLAIHPNALTTGDPRCPAAIIRLAKVLQAAGIREVVRPACAGCGRSDTELPRPSTEGRVCQACAARDPSKKKPCARCGRTARIVARRDEGGICWPCYRHDPLVIEVCSGCGNVRIPVTRRADGAPVCEKCWTPPAHTCSVCGKHRPSQGHGPDGPLCSTCYRRPRRTCGNCGRTQQISRRATDKHPDLCWNCAVPPEATCSACGRTRPCGRNSAGEPVCRSCRPRPTRPCSVCGRQRRITARWPRGPVCATCYARTLDHPGQCPGCSELRPLIGYCDGHEICGPCAGAPDAYRCTECGSYCRTYADERCPRCVVRTRLGEHLAGPDGQVAAQLLPLLDALAAAKHPRAMLQWLRRSPNARLLGELAAAGNVLSHEMLDELPPSRYERYVRQSLVHTGILPERHEELDRIPVWLDRLLAERPARHALLIRPYTHWFLLKRARRRAAQRRRPALAGPFLRTRIRLALEFLSWLDEYGIELSSLTQADLDCWLAEGNTRRYAIRYFLDWAANRRTISQRLTVPTIPRQEPARILGEDERWHLLRLCLCESTLPLDVRTAGALLLLFGLPASQIRTLRAEQLQQQDDAMFLAVGTPPLFIPPKLAALLRRIAEHPPRQAKLVGAEPGPWWLFPGLLPGRPASPSWFSRNLLDHGIDARPARNAALVALVEDIPPAVLSDLLGLHVNTAVRWADIAKRDWTDYLATRAANLVSAEERRRPTPGIRYLRKEK